MKFVSHQHQAVGNNINEFCRSFQYWLEIAASGNPHPINSHSGKDYFLLDEQLLVIDTAENFVKKIK